MFGRKDQNRKAKEWHHELAMQKSVDEEKNLYGRHGSLIEAKLKALEEKLTKQMLCSHNNYSIETRSFNPSLYPCFSPILFYKKTCDDCGIDMGAATSQEKEQRDYEIAKQKVEQFEESQLKEPEELLAEATEFRGDFSAMRQKIAKIKAREAEEALSETLYEVEMTCSMCREGAFKLAEAIRTAVDTLKKIQD